MQLNGAAEGEGEQTSNGKWRMENGEWRMAMGKATATGCSQGCHYGTPALS